MSEKRVIGIRGLDECLYDEIQNYAKKSEQNIADIFNKALELFLKETAKGYRPPVIVSGHSRFIINGDALVHLAPLRVENCERVVVENDEKLTPELVETNLEGIRNADEIHVPQRLYYLIVKKAKNAERIIPYEGKYRTEETLEFNSPIKISKGMLDRFQQQNKRIKIIADGDLWIEFNVPVDLFDDVVSRVEVDGAFFCSEELQPIALTKAVVSGNLGVIDENNTPLEVQQVTRAPRHSRHRRPGAPPPFIDLSGIADAIRDIKRSIADFGPQVQEELKEAFKDLNVEVSERKSKAKDRRRASPGQVRPFPPRPPEAPAPPDNHNEVDVDIEDDEEEEEDEH
ncbi:MAG TPA: hypothetical protein VJ044_17855 [Candidatus Hodarchaeales archaeon]|nr:hypothetical protein [Candidatus Hodarchaeales archaeon]